MLLFALLITLMGLATATTNHLTDFFLVTTSSPAKFSNPAALPDVNATSLFEPYTYSNSAFYLRLIAPGYNTLPCFNLTAGHLSTTSPGPHGMGMYTYWSHSAYEHLPFWFNTELVKTGSPILSLQKGHLLAVGGMRMGGVFVQGRLGRVW